MTARTFHRSLKTTVIAVGLLPALLGPLTGCEDVKPPIGARQDPYQPGQIHLTSDVLRRDTALGVPRAYRDDSGLLYVDVPIRAATNLKLYVDYRATFFDRQGRQLSQSGWLSKTLSPNVPDQFTVNSTSPLAQDFQIDLRPSE